MLSLSTTVWLFSNLLQILKRDVTLEKNNIIATKYLEFIDMFIGQYAQKEASLVAQKVKNLPAMWETWVQSLGLEDPLEKGMATHSSNTAWRIPWTEKPGELYSPWDRKESDTTEQLTPLPPSSKGHFLLSCCCTLCLRRRSPTAPQPMLPYQQWLTEFCQWGLEAEYLRVSAKWKPDSRVFLPPLCFRLPSYCVCISLL